MTVSYKKLWKLLIDKNLKKKDLIRIGGFCVASSREHIVSSCISLETLPIF